MNILDINRLAELIAESKKIFIPQPMPFVHGNLSLFGISVTESRFIPRVPVLQVDPNFKWCTEEARADMNAWLVERFGYKTTIYFADVTRAVVDPDIYAKLRNLT